MYLAIQMNDLEQFKTAVSRGAIMENDFSPFSVRFTFSNLKITFLQSRTLHVHRLADNGMQEQRVQRKNPLEYALDCVTQGNFTKIIFEIFPISKSSIFGKLMKAAARQANRTFDEFKRALLSDVNKYLLLEYPQFINSKVMRKLTMLLNYVASSLISRNNRQNQRNNAGFMEGLFYL